MMKIQDQLPQFSFGLFSECPSDVPVAWGARAIADSGVGFSLLHDRQTWIGDSSVREPFKVALDKALPIANRNCKRLRHGWDPIKELVEGDLKQFKIFFHKRVRELQGDQTVEQLAKYLSKLCVSTLAPKPSVEWQEVCSFIKDPASLRRTLAAERRAKENHWAKMEQLEQKWERNPLRPPSPPEACEAAEDADYFEEGEEVCDEVFTSDGKGGYTGCRFEDDCWICENCNYCHYIDWDEVINEALGNPEPASKFTRIFSPVFEQTAYMRSDKAQTFEVFNDGRMVIKANTNASHGYIYLVAYPLHAADTRKLKWPGKEPPPAPGCRINIQMNNIGEATVVSHLAQAEYLMLSVVASDPPDFIRENIARNESSGLLDISGIDIG